MKNNAIKMFLAVGAACVCGSALNAQSTNDLLVAKVPFAFQAAGENFGAGTYLLREHGNTGVPSIKDATTGHTVFVPGANRALTHAGAPRLVFHCYAGNSCFLAEIRPETGDGINVSMTKTEKALANGDQHREMATISVDLRYAD